MLTSIFFSLSSLRCTLQTNVVQCFASFCVVLFLHTNQITTHHNRRPFTEKYAESSSLLARQTVYDNNQEILQPIVCIKTLQVSSERLMQGKSLFNLQAPCVLYIGQAFRYSPENAFYIFNSLAPEFFFFYFSTHCI